MSANHPTRAYHMTSSPLGLFVSIALAIALILTAAPTAFCPDYRRQRTAAAPYGATCHRNVCRR